MTESQEKSAQTHALASCFFSFGKTIAGSFFERSWHASLSALGVAGPFGSKFMRKRLLVYGIPCLS